MEKRTIIELTETDVETAIREYVDQLAEKRAIKMRFIMAVDGDYDRGTARQYVKKVICECV